MSVYLGILGVYLVTLTGALANFRVHLVTSTANPSKMIVHPSVYPARISSSSAKGTSY